MLYPAPTAKLIDSLIESSGIDIKAAIHLTFCTTGMSDEDVNEFTKNLLVVKHESTYYSVYGNLTGGNPCNICTDETRDHSVTLVVEDSKDVSAMERIQEYHGPYHALHGLASPVNGAGPDGINLRLLITCLMDSGVNEVTIATNVTTNGEATSMYISHVLEPAGAKVTRLARGLAAGSDIEHTSGVILLRTIENRTEL